MVGLSVKKGAVTFLDVIGWKGIWEREKDAVVTLHGLIEKIAQYASNITNIIGNEDSAERGITTKVISISDTIAIFTFGDPYHTIKIHAEICRLAIPESIKRRLPLRGAICYGEYSYIGNIMVGPAVDEAASWHESTDWIGAILTPSGKFQLRNNYPEQFVKYADIPFKNKTYGLDICVGWEFPDDELYELFNEMGPFSPEIAPKFLNTFNFIMRGR